MVKFIKSLLFIIASLVMSVCILLIPESSGTISVTYLSVLGIYLGIDIADTIIKSSQMSKGKYKPLHKHKFVISFICLVILIICCLYVDANIVSTALTTFISSILIIIGLIIGGLEGNKIAANAGEVSDE